MQIECSSCRRSNEVGNAESGTRYRCAHCGAFLPTPQAEEGETSAAVGMLGGAALGAALGGPIGAIFGGIVGAVLGKSAKGVG
jgi:hypothetical protein